MVERRETEKRRRRIRILLIFVVLIVGLVYLFRAVLTPFLVAMFAAYLLDPLVERLAPIRIVGRFPLGRGGAIVAIYLVFLAAVYVGGLFAVPALRQQVLQARRDLPRAQAFLEDRVERAAGAWDTFVHGDAPGPETVPAGAPTVSEFNLKGGGKLEGEVIARFEDSVVLKIGNRAVTIDKADVEFEKQVSRGPGGSFNGRQLARRAIEKLVLHLDRVLFFALDVVVALIRWLYQVVLIMMITAFIVIDRDAIVGFFRKVPPGRYRKIYDRLRDYMDRGLAGVIRGQLTICLVNGLLTWVGLLFLDVRYSGLLGFIAGVFSLIPIFGTILSTIPIVLIAWGTGSVQKAVLALGWILVIHFLEANFLNPKIMGSASKIHPVVVIFALLAGEHAYGIVGALLAVPAASIIQSSFKFYVLDRVTEQSEGEDGEGDTMIPAPAE